MTPRAEEAISPVVGTLLILAITVVAMVGILAWGAPTIEAIQAQNAQVAVVGEFEELRSSSIDLSIPDASRVPTVNVPRGDLAIVQGTRVMVTSNQDDDNPDCDFHVLGWTGTSPDTAVDVSADNCRAIVTSGCTAAQACLEVLEVVGSNTVGMAVAYAGSVATVAGADFSQDNWLFRLTDGDDLAPEVYAQAYLLDSDMVQWDLGTSSGQTAAYFDLGAVFSADDGSYFLEKSPSLQESEFGTGVYAVRLRTLSDAGGTSAISGRGAYQVFMGLVGNYVRVDSDEVYRMRYDFQGPLAESWCGALLLRSASLTDAAYAEDPDPDLQCEQDSDTNVRSVTYERTGGATPAHCATLCFELEVIHASIRVSLAN